MKVGHEGEPPMVKHVREKKKAARSKTHKTIRRIHKPAISEEQAKILQHGAIYCLRNFPTLWTVGEIKEEKAENGRRRWIIAVYLRYPTGFEGYLGDLLYNGKHITELTDRNIMRARARRIEAWVGRRRPNTGRRRPTRT
jgi:hypothetical protein